MRPRLPLAEKLSRALSIPAADIQGILDAGPTPANWGPCWQWWGYRSGHTPVMNHNGRPVPVRRVTREALTGYPVAAETRVKPMCPTLFCVNPNHCFEQLPLTGLDAQLRLALEFPAEGDDPIEDVVDAVYSRDQPWDAQALATEFDYSLALVEEAIAGILAGQY